MNKQNGENKEETHLKPKNLKEFLASFDFENYCVEHSGLTDLGVCKSLSEDLKAYEEELKEYMPTQTDNLRSYQLANLLSVIGDSKLYFSEINLSKIKIDTPKTILGEILKPDKAEDILSNMKNNLLEYINLYKKVFKDEFEEFIKLNPNLEAILNELSNKIERDKDNPNKLVLWSKFAVSLMGAICTFSLLYFLNKDVKQAVRHPIQKARLSKIEAMYDETLNQIESFKDQQKSKTNKERS